MAELWDAYDVNLNKIEGAVLVRGEKIPDGTYHLVCDVLVRHVDGSFLLVQRHPQKHFGLTWEASAGGSALKGETAKDCALRELFEETGIVPTSVKQLGHVVHHRHKCIFVEFLCETDCAKDGVKLQESETVAYRWVKAEELNNMSVSQFPSTRIFGFVDLSKM